MKKALEKKKKKYEWCETGFRRATKKGPESQTRVPDHNGGERVRAEGEKRMAFYPPPTSSDI